MAKDRGEIDQLWYVLSFAGLEARGEVDSVMLMDRLRQKSGGTVYGKDIKPAFNSIERRNAGAILGSFPYITSREDGVLDVRNF